VACRRRQWLALPETTPVTSRGECVHAAPFSPPHPLPLARPPARAPAPPQLELSWGQRYGLIGRNGCGKSTMLQCIAAKEVPIPSHIDTYLLAEEAQPSDATALQYVIER
jgi:ABC-type transport system involved in cytochrome bd biosynthesis fused ATPase/permease subunit